jgi:phosphoribosylformylglycinamidine synthase
MKFAIIVFPGSNCDHDAYHAAKHVLGQDAAFVWHKETSLAGADAVILPGGFSHGDYLRVGAVARFSPVMDAVRAFADAGGPVLGICNGFQVLCEAHLLPGALTRNERLRFICRDQQLRVESTSTLWTSNFTGGQVITIPVKNGEGRYVADQHTLDTLEQEGRVVFRYLDGNPSGAMRDIAGITDPTGRIVGLMPHPEHAIDPLTGPGQDGLELFLSLLASRVAA